MFGSASETKITSGLQKEKTKYREGQRNIASHNIMKQKSEKDTTLSLSSCWTLSRNSRFFQETSDLRTPATFSGDSHEHLHGGCQKVGPKVAKFHEMLEQKRRQATFHRNSTPREESQALNNQRKCS